MGNSRLTIAIMLKSLLILCLYGFSVNYAVAADGAATSKAETATKNSFKSQKKQPVRNEILMLNVFSVIPLRVLRNIRLTAMQQPKYWVNLSHVQIATIRSVLRTVRIQKK